MLPGTGGLTRVVDKRKVRRDLADVFCTVAEGVKGKRAKQWGLVDEVVPRSKFDETRGKRARESWPRPSPARAEQGRRAHAAGQEDRRGSCRIQPRDGGDRSETACGDVDRAWVLRGDLPRDADAIRKLGAAWWPLAAFRELDDALCQLRINEDEIGLMLLKTEGEIDAVAGWTRTLDSPGRRLVRGRGALLQSRVLRRLDLTARSLFALVEPGSCFAGTLLEIALAADRSYMLDDPDQPGRSRGHRDERRCLPDVSRL